MPADNMRFGAMAAEARNNDSANLKLPCAAERVVEAATDAKPPLRYLQAPKRRRESTVSRRMYSPKAQ